jgi:putative ABC transport system permease protein
MQRLLQDLRYGISALRRNAGSTSIIILVLALGIGANVAIFTVVSAVLLRRLPYQDPDRLVVLWEVKASKGIRYHLSALDYIDFAGQQKVFDQIGAFYSKPVNLTGSDLPERLEMASASPALLHLMGAAPALGRIFTDQEDQPGKNHVAILSDGLWRRRFGADPNILGTAVILDGVSYTIIGVMPSGVRLLDTSSDLWTPYSPTPAELTPEKRGYRPPTMVVAAHLKTGVSMAQAADQMNRIAKRLEEQYSDLNAGFRAELVPLREYLIGSIRTTLWTLLGSVAFVLLIACSNVANLLLARASTREKEIAVRTALGADPRRLLQQLLTESVLLALIGGFAGLLLAEWGVSLLRALAPAGIPRANEISIDWRVLVFALTLSIVTGILFGLAPALSTIRADLNSILKTSGRSTTGNRSRSRLRDAIVVCEIAACVVLLGGAGLLVRTLLRLQQVNPGFRADHILTMQVALPEARYSGLQVAMFHQRLIDRVRALPGVEAAGIARYLPLSGSDASLNFQIEFRPVALTADQPRAKYRAASAGYFSAMGIPLLKGRYFDGSDGEHTQKVAILNEATARQFWPNEDPVGKRIHSGIDEVNWYTIVGVVGNVKHAGLSAQPNPEVYYHYLQVPADLMNFVEGTMTLVVRTSSEPSSMASPIRKEMHALDPNQPVFNVKTMEDLLEGSIAESRFRAFLLAAFAGLALLLAALGLYGVISYSVSQRTNELGVRAALGARSRDILNLVIGHGARLAGIGLAIGLLLSFGFAKALSNLLFGVGVFDPVTFTTTAAVIFGVALVASFVPALRATRVDPMIALREE